MKYTIYDEYFETKKQADNYFMSVVNEYEKKERSKILLTKEARLTKILDYCYEHYLSSDLKYVNRKKLHIKPTDWYVIFQNDNNVSVGHKSPDHPVPMSFNRRKAFYCFGTGKESRKNNLREAARNEINDQIRQAVDTYKESNVCYYCEKEFNYFDGDHVYPFKNLWPEFCQAFLIDVDKIELTKKMYTNFYGYSFADDNLVKQWREFHFSRMIIVPACRDCNDLKAKSERKNNA